MTELTPFWAAYCTVLVFFLGACWGSFLNVCIYRIPHGKSVVTPRSHCPSCSHFIAWYDNIPMLSWLFLGGRCRACKTPISPRYFLVELLTALLFLLVWNRYGLDPRTAVYSLVVFGFVLGTFVDIDHRILPDRVTIGGMILGVLASALVPSLHGAAGAVESIKSSIIGLCTGFGVLFAVVELGKLAFGRKRVVTDPSEPLAFETAGETTHPALRIGNETMPWDDLFYRRSDRWRFEASSALLGDQVWTKIEAVLSKDGLRINGQLIPPGELSRFRATLTAYTYPREAMGFGDVKLMGAIGAFFGVQAVAFVLLFSALLGSIGGGLLLWWSRKGRDTTIPYGPYIALAAVLWMLGGDEYWTRYLHGLMGMP